MKWWLYRRLRETTPGRPVASSRMPTWICSWTMLDVYSITLASTAKSCLQESVYRYLAI